MLWNGLLTRSLHRCELMQNQHQEPDGSLWSLSQLVGHMCLDWIELCLVLKDHKILPNQSPLSALDQRFLRRLPFLRSIPGHKGETVITSLQNVKLRSIKVIKNQTWSTSPEGSEVHRGSFISSHANMVGSSLYVIFVIVLTLFRTVYCNISRY